MSETVVINEVSPRDGLQNQSRTLSVDERRRLIAALVDAGVRAIEAGSFVSPKAVPQMAGSDALFANLPGTDVTYSALVPNLKGYQRAVAAGAQSIAVVLSATDTMNRKNINMTLEETTAACADIVTTAERDGIEARAYVAVAFECPFEGPVAPAIVADLTDRMFDAGAAEVIVADTIGAADPAAVSSLLTRLTERHPAAWLSCHFHDTRAMALANIYAAVQAGIRKFDSSIGGLGGCPFSPGASGNVATEDVVMMLEQMGYNTGIDQHGLQRARVIAEQLTGVPLGGRAQAWLARHYSAEAPAGARAG